MRPARSSSSRYDEESILFDDDVATLDEQLPQAGLPIRQQSLRNLPRGLDSIRFCHIIEYGDRGTVAKENAFRIDSD